MKVWNRLFSRKHATFQYSPTFQKLSNIDQRRGTSATGGLYSPRAVADDRGRLSTTPTAQRIRHLVVGRKHDCALQMFIYLKKKQPNVQWHRVLAAR